MGRGWKTILKEPSLVQPFLLLAYHEADILSRVRKQLVSYFGPVEYETRPFSALNWLSVHGFPYKWLCFLCFNRLMKREELVHLRQRTLSMEAVYFSRSSNRPLIELDPGYVTYYTVVRSSLTDDFHKIYLYGGIYAETLFWYERLSFRPYSHVQQYFFRKDVVTSFNDMRAIYLATHKK